MPGKDMSKMIGKSPSPVIQTVVDNNKNVQQPLNPSTATSQAFNKHPVKVPVK